MKARARKTFRLSIIALALMGGAGAQAATVTTGFMDQSTATDNSNNGLIGVAQTANSTFTLPQYVGGNVLTGVTFSAASSASSPVTSNFSNGSWTGTTLFSGAYTTGAGGSSNGSSSTSVISGNTYTLSYTTGVASVPNANLGQFVSGNVSGSVTESIAISENSGSSTLSTISVNPANHQATVTYTYADQAHANGSIGTGPSNPGVGVNSLNYTFPGLFLLNEASSPLNFSIFNGTGLFGMDIQGITCLGDCGVFSLTGTFQDIAGGGSKSGSVAFLGAAPPLPTTFSATYTFVVGDDNGPVGAGKNFNIENLSMTVMAQAVPEASEWAMMLAGLGMVGMIARRRRIS